MPKIDHEYTDEVVCPWCGYEVDDSFEFEDEFGEERCYECDKKYTYTRYTRVEYSTEKKDQDND